MNITERITSLTKICFHFTGPFVLLVKMFNASHRQVIIFAGFFSALSTFLSAFAEEIEVLYVTYGLFTGKKK